MQAAESDNSAAAWTFSQCLDYAYSNNISLQRLVLDNQSDDATLEQSKAQWQPTLGFSTTQGYINYASPSENQTANVYSGSYGLNASWTVFNGNIRRNQIKYDEMQQRISALGIDEQRYTLQTEILSKYLNILYVNPAKRNVLDLKNETCKNREKRNVLNKSHTRHCKAIKKQSRTGCFYSF